MNSRVFRLDQIVSILLTMIAVVTAVFYFTHAEHHLIKLKLCKK